MLSNKADTAVHTPVTKRQVFQLHDIFIKNGVKKEKLQSFLKDNERVQGFIKDLENYVDPWAKEKKRIEVFYKRFFKRTIDWSKVTLPERKFPFKKLEYVFKDITCDEMIKVYKERFHEMYYPVNAFFGSEGIDRAIKNQQNRPSKDYVIAHVGNPKPDMLYTSYDDGISQKIQFMVPIEGIIAMTRRHFETGIMYDKGETNLAALYRGGIEFGMKMFYQHGFPHQKYGHFTIGYDEHRGTRIGLTRGLRQVAFKES